MQDPFTLQSLALAALAALGAMSLTARAIREARRPTPVRIVSRRPD